MGRALSEAASDVDLGEVAKEAGKGAVAGAIGAGIVGKVAKGAKVAKKVAKAAAKRQAGKQVKKGGEKKNAEGASNRAKSIQKGVPENQISPSGEPKIHKTKHSSIKKAKDSARARVGKGGSTTKHISPKKGKPHFHGVTKKGKQDRIHHEFP